MPKELEMSTMTWLSRIPRELEITDIIGLLPMPKELPISTGIQPFKELGISIMQPVSSTPLIYLG
jgi:hypothetical protein